MLFSSNISQKSPLCNWLMFVQLIEGRDHISLSEQSSDYFVDQIVNAYGSDYSPGQGKWSKCGIFLRLHCDQTVQLFSTVLKRFCPLDSKNVFVLVLAHLERELFEVDDIGDDGDDDLQHHYLPNFKQLQLGFQMSQDQNENIFRI